MRGFSIVEIIITIALVAVLGTAVTPFFMQTAAWFEVRSSTQQIANIIERTKILATAQVEDDDWSLYFATSSVTVFKGDNYSGRDQNFDERYVFSNKTTISPTENPLTFEVFSGFTSANSTTTIQTRDLTREIVLTPEGVISY